MALPAWLTAALGQHPDHLTEDDLYRVLKATCPRAST